MPASIEDRDVVGGAAAPVTAPWAPIVIAAPATAFAVFWTLIRLLAMSVLLTTPDAGHHGSDVARFVTGALLLALIALVAFVLTWRASLRGRRTEAWLAAAATVVAACVTYAR